MSTFGGLIFTNVGRNLQAKVQAGALLNFTHIAIGDGDLAGSSIADLTALKHQVKSCNITKLKTMTGGKAVVGTSFSNQDIISGFYWKELGVFAQDPDLGEILYCYGNSGVNAEYIPAGGGPDIIEKSIDCVTIVGNASNVTATIESSLVFVSMQDFEDHANDNVIHVTQTDRDTWNAKETTAGVQTIVDTAITALLDGAPGALDTLKELADALGDDANFATTITNALATKASQASLTAHLADYVHQIGYGATTGSANTYALTLDPAPPALVDGLCVSLKITTVNTSASTINVNGFGAKPIVDSKGNAMTSGKLKAGSIYTMRYNGANFILQGEGASGNAIASDLLSGKTASVDAGDIVGTLALTGTAVAADIVSGKTAYNTDAKTKVTGTNTNKKWASGTATATSGNSTFLYASGVSFTKPSVTVSGLNFVPSVVLLEEINQYGTAFTTLYPAGHGDLDATFNIGRICMYSGTESSNTASVTFINAKLDGTYAKSVNGGFTLPVYSAVSNYKWTAFE